MHLQLTSIYQTAALTGKLDDTLKLKAQLCMCTLPCPVWLHAHADGLPSLLQPGSLQ